MPIGVGEPHYAQIIKADKLQAWEVYPEIGWDPAPWPRRKGAPQLGTEGVDPRRQHRDREHDRHPQPLHARAGRVQKGDTVVWNITNVENTYDATHGFALPDYNINLSLEPGETETMTFVADKAGVFPYYCTEFCSALHLEMAGYFLVEE